MSERTHARMLSEPNTAMDSTKQFVQCTLVFKTSDDYPASIPDISITHERGISESDKGAMMKVLKSLTQLRGTTVDR